MEQSARTVPCSAMYKPVKFCLAFIVLTGLGIALVYGLMQLTGPTVVVRTTSGAVQGFQLVSASGRRFFSFQGLPYAQPPLGPLRFKDPQLPPPTWKSTLPAKNPRDVCLVLERGAAGRYVGSEDCLYLNVFTPQLEGDAAVIVWLGAGSFGFSDAGAHRLRVDRLVDRGLVVVTVEYRRGVLGFLSTGDSGNFGLKDQVAALRWVRANIAAFGGGAARISLTGEGAGAASVGFHMLSPRSRGLFNRAIALGGSPLNPWAFSDLRQDAPEVFSDALPSVGDGYWNSSHVVDYLRTLSVDELVARLPDTYQKRDPAVTHLYAPSTEPATLDAFMTGAPWRVLEDGLPNAVPFLTGCSSAAGKQLLKASRPAALEQNFLQLVGRAVRRSHVADRRRLAQLVSSFYFGDDAIASAGTEDVLNLLTDIYYLEGIDRMARSVAALSPYHVYYYHYTYERNDTQDGTALPGAMHGADAYALLRPPDVDQGSGSLSETSVDLAWLSMLTEFAKTGNPTSAKGVSWPPYTAADPAYLEVSGELRARRDLLPARTDFWRSVLPLPSPSQV